MFRSRSRSGAGAFPSRGRGAFTLLEVLAALAVMAVALSVLLVERNNTVKRTARTNQRRIALQLAKEKTFEILSGAETGHEGSFEENPAFAWSAFEEADSVTGSSAIAYLRRVTVTVRFEIPGGEDSVKLQAWSRR